MEGWGGCCIARYSIGSYDHIMLRFRPIAPKPTTGGQPGPGESSEVSSFTPSGSGRGKRKCQQHTKRCTRRRRSQNSVLHGGADAVTLSLLPETPDQADLKTPVEEEEQKPQGPFWLSFGDGGGMHAPAVKRTLVISSCVTVERVTDAWVDGNGLGRSDEERELNLVRDTCPGFISDGSGRVTWTNEAYRKMARDNIPVEEGRSNNNKDSFHVMVRLEMKERPMITYGAFTRRVKLQHTCLNRERGSVTVPCDAWRMDSGGFAWRLDVKAALCLSTLTAI